MTIDDFQRAAVHFGVNAEQAEDFRRAFIDCGLMGLDAFLDAVQAEHQAALDRAKSGQLPTDAERRRLEARRIVASEMLGSETYDALAHFHDGTTH